MKKILLLVIIMVLFGSVTANADVVVNGVDKDFKLVGIKKSETISITIQNMDTGKYNEYYFEKGDDFAQTISLSEGTYEIVDVTSLAKRVKAYTSIVKFTVSNDNKSVIIPITEKSGMNLLIVFLKNNILLLTILVVSLVTYIIAKRKRQKGVVLS